MCLFSVTRLLGFPIFLVMLVSAVGGDCRFCGRKCANNGSLSQHELACGKTHDGSVAPTPTQFVDVPSKEIEVGHVVVERMSLHPAEEKRALDVATHVMVHVNNASPFTKTFTVMPGTTLVMRRVKAGATVDMHCTVGETPGHLVGKVFHHVTRADQVATLLFNTLSQQKEWDGVDESLKVASVEKKEGRAVSVTLSRSDDPTVYAFNTYGLTWKALRPAPSIDSSSGEASSVGRKKYPPDDPVGLLDAATATVAVLDADVVQQRKRYTNDRQVELNANISDSLRDEEAAAQAGTNFTKAREEAVAKFPTSSESNSLTVTVEQYRSKLAEAEVAKTKLQDQLRTLLGNEGSSSLDDECPPAKKTRGK